MAFGKRKVAPPAEPAPPAGLPPSAEDRERALLAEIDALRAKLDQYVEERVQILKASRDGAELPIDFLRAQVTRGECLCKSAARLLGDTSA